MGKGGPPHSTDHCGGLSWTGDMVWLWLHSCVDLGVECYHIW